MYVINPKEETYKAHALMTYSSQKQTDYIRLAAITYQSFGLDKKREAFLSFSFFGAADRT
jgi:hypothetical protein